MELHRCFGHIAPSVAHQLAVKDASLTRTYSFLPASWAGDAHEETDFLPIGDREEEEYLNRRTDSLVAILVLMAKYLQTTVEESKQEDWIA